ncbi:NF041680 family putative transposase [Hamadaea tsunoensis]|uniref:NF041680 family putative transposase n=1 Tax=Hamadaea tsunoensis TaxID=53368 RepID=UPI000401A862|nr:NF041680 family putative transposase [Hamadaea tsunoensis]
MTTSSSVAHELAGAQQALREFRHQVYDCLDRWPDALFDLVDAQASAVAVDGLAHLTLAPGARRGHGSAYRAIADGAIDTGMLRETLAGFRPAEWEPTFAVDTTLWARPAAQCSPERGLHKYNHAQAQITNGKPITAGWSYSWLVNLSTEPGSWVAPLDVSRVNTSQTCTETAIGQILLLLPLLEHPRSQPLPLFVCDAGYDAVTLGVELADQPVQTLIRLRNDRVMWTRPQPPTGKRGPGTPRRHGRRFHFAHPESHTPPDHELALHDPVYGNVHVTAWHQLHPETQTHYRDPDGRPSIIEATILRLTVDKTPRHRQPGPIWLWFNGPADTFDPDRCWRAYLRRFDVEHFFRFARQNLGWATPRLRHPQQADRFSQLTAITATQLRLARPLVADHRLPWQKPLTSQQMTPGRVRQGFTHLLATIDTPARWPKPTKPGPGRPKGRTSEPAPRYEPTRTTKVKIPKELIRP